MTAFSTDARSMAPRASATDSSGVVALLMLARAIRTMLMSHAHGPISRRLASPHVTVQHAARCSQIGRVEAFVELPVNRFERCAPVCRQRRSVSLSSDSVTGAGGQTHCGRPIIESDLSRADVPLE